MFFNIFAPIVEKIIPFFPTPKLQYTLGKLSSSSIIGKESFVSKYVPEKQFVSFVS